MDFTRRARHGNPDTGPGLQIYTDDKEFATRKVRHGEHRGINHPPNKGGMANMESITDTLYIPVQLRRAVQCSLTPPQGDRYRQLFVLARRVAALQPRPSQRALRWAVNEWNRLSAWPADGRWQRQLWGQFLAALERVKQPKGECFRKLVESAKDNPAPLCTLGDKDPRRVLLAKICLAMERQYKAPWSLSGPQAGEALGVSETHARRLLGALKKAGIIMQVSPGERGPRAKKAAMWRFVGRQ